MGGPSLNYSLPISSAVPPVPPAVEDKVPRVFAAFNLVWQVINQYKALFVRYCGVSPMPVGMWEVLAGDPSTLVIAGNLTRFYCPALVSVTQGQLVNLVVSGGVLKAQVADRTIAGLHMDGFAPQAVAAGSIGEFILRRGILTTSQTLVPGQDYWLATAGGLRSTPLTTAGTIEQYIGKAITTSQLYCDSTSWIQH